MLVKMKVHITGSRGGKLWPGVGGVVEVSDGEGFDLIASGYAEEVTGDGATAADDAGSDAASNDDGGDVSDGRQAAATRPSTTARKRGRK